MKHILTIIIAMLCISGVNAQIYHDMRGYTVYGTLAPDAAKSYSRLPDSLSTQVRESLWNMGQNSAGLSIRFTTNATDIYARWSSLNQTKMNHMNPVGIRGMDLYVLNDDNTWAFVGSAIPSSKEETKATIVKGMSAKMRDYLLFLPLYDGIYNLQIGVNKGAVIKEPENAVICREKPVVMYGTSILQGGCASRPGMAHTNILQRMLNREVFNLGFSGNGHLDPEIASLMAAKDAGVYVIDVLPNNTIKSLGTKLEPFYRILRKAHPDTPILLVESPLYPRTRIDAPYRKGILALNGALRDFYDRMVAEGDSNIHYFEGKDILDDDCEGSIDGIHFTDIGFKNFAHRLYPVLKKIIEKSE